MGTWTSAVYTPEQQDRLGVDENGDAVEKSEGDQGQTSELLASRETSHARHRDTKPVWAVFLPVAGVLLFFTSLMLFVSGRSDSAAVTQQTPHTC